MQSNPISMLFWINARVVSIFQLHSVKFSLQCSVHFKCFAIRIVCSLSHFWYKYLSFLYFPLVLQVLWCFSAMTYSGSFDLRSSNPNFSSYFYLFSFRCLVVAWLLLGCCLWWEFSRGFCEPFIPGFVYSSLFRSELLSDSLDTKLANKLEFCL